LILRSLSSIRIHLRTAVKIL